VQYAFWTAKLRPHSTPRKVKVCTQQTKRATQKSSAAVTHQSEAHQSPLVFVTIDIASPAAAAARMGLPILFFSPLSFPPNDVATFVFAVSL